MKHRQTNCISRRITLTVICCLLYLLVRVTILYTAVDHLHGIDMAEFRIIGQAKAFLDGEGALESYVHLWGTPISAVLIMPFMLLPVDDIIVLKLFILTLSVIGFAALIYLIAWKQNLYSAGLVAFLLIFAPVSHLKWSLMVWGAYPEAYALMPVALVLWVRSLEKPTKPRLFIAGSAAAFLVTYTPACITVMAAVSLLTIYTFLVEKKDGKPLVVFFAGMAILFVFYIAVSQVQNAFNDQEIATQFDGAAFRLTDHLQLPQPSRFINLVNNMEMEHIFITSFERIVLVLALVWVLILGFSRKKKLFQMILVFPVIVLMGFGFILMFPLSEWVGLRHFLGIITAAYVCIGLAAADVFPGVKNVALIFLDRAWRLGIVVILVLINLADIMPLIQPENGGMIWRYRGGTYYAKSLGSIIGAEVDRVNYLLDSYPEMLNESDEQNGFGDVFYLTGSWICCQMYPFKYKYDLLNIEKVKDMHAYFRMLGCALAFKTYEQPEMIDTMQTDEWPKAKDWMHAGYQLCAAMPCAELTFGRQRPALLQRTDEALKAFRLRMRKWTPFVHRNFNDDVFRFKRVRPATN